MASEINPLFTHQPLKLLSKEELREWSTFDEHNNPRPWSDYTREQEALSPYSHIIRAVTPCGVCAILIYRRIENEFEIFQLTVKKEKRGNGFGNLILRELIKVNRECLAEGGKIFLEVAADNGHAIAIYSKNGFQKVGVRKRYYPDGADALLMEKRGL